MNTSIRAGLAGLMMASALVACGQKKNEAPAEAAQAPAAAASAEEKVVNVYNWSDYIDPAVLEQFTAETGIKVNYDVFDSNEVLETKLLAGNTGYDVVVPTAAFMERQIKAGVFRKLDRYAANLALLTDVSLGALGGRLKFKESLSGRLGDVLSHLYMMGAVLKRHHDEGAPEADKPLLAWAFHNSAYEIELALSQALRNFPIKPLGWLLWPLVFPFGRRAVAPGDRLSHRVAMLLMAPNEARERLAQGVFLTPCENNPGGRIDSYLAKAILAEPVERKFLKALKSSDIEALDFASQLDEGVREGWISVDERRQLEELREITLDTISVDDFDVHELRAASYYDLPQQRHQPREAA